MPIEGATPKVGTTAALAASLVAKAGPGTLYKITGTNTLATAQFLQVHDAASLPADGAIPKLVIAVAGNGNIDLDYGTIGRDFSNGIVICNSTTAPTKTIGAANLWLDAIFT